MIFGAMKTLDGVVLDAPVRLGQVVVRDIRGTGVDFIATRDLKAESKPPVQLVV